MFRNAEAQVLKAAPISALGKAAKEKLSTASVQHPLKAAGTVVRNIGHATLRPALGLAHSPPARTKESAPLTASNRVDQVGFKHAPLPASGEAHAMVKAAAK